MGAEKSSWYNTMLLVGYAASRGTAWHYRMEDQGAEPNHYDGAIPVDDVIRRLFNFNVGSYPVYVQQADDSFVAVPNKQALRCDDNGDVLGIFAESYTGHQYREWLIDQVSALLSDDLGIGGAGLLKNRAQAYVQVEMPESITTPEGVEFRPHLLATTSFDGTIATTYKKTNTIVVCDNTREMALNGAGEQFKVKHSKYSAMKLNDAREALAIVHTMADDFAAEVASLCSVEVNDKQFDKFLSLYVPLDKDAPEGRSRTVAENKRDAITALYRNDERAATWTGTAYGVLQAVNTYGQHMTQVRTRGGEDAEKANRAQRIMENVLSGSVAKSDANCLTILTKALNRKALVTV